MMSIVLVVIGGLSLLLNSEESDEDKGKSLRGSKKGGHTSKHELHLDFYKFRRQYMIVYWVIMLADWMQGTHMYTLYLR